VPGCVREMDAGWTGIGWRAEVWRRSLEKRSVPCRFTVEAVVVVVVETGTYLACEAALCGRQVYDLGRIGPDARPGQARAGHREVSFSRVWEVVYISWEEREQAKEERR